MDDLHIAVDFDETLVEQSDVLCQMLCRDYDADVYPEDLRVWGQDIPGTEMTWGRALATYWQNEAFVAAVPPMSGAVEMLSELDANGATISIATHRPERDRDVTVAWLDANGVPYDNFRCGKGWDKSTVGADVLIDDQPRNIRDAANTDQHGILVLRLFNFDALDDLPDSKFVHTALDVTPHSALCLATRPHLQWAAFRDIIEDIAADTDR